MIQLKWRIFNEKIKAKKKECIYLFIDILIIAFYGGSVFVLFLNALIKPI